MALTSSAQRYPCTFIHFLDGVDQPHPRAYWTPTRRFGMDCSDSSNGIVSPRYTPSNVLNSMRMFVNTKHFQQFPPPSNFSFVVLIHFFQLLQVPQCSHG